MKLVLLAAVAASSMAAPAASQVDRNEPIVIRAQAPAGLVQWRQTVGRELDRNLTYPRTYPGWEFPEGAVSVHFTCGEDGKPSAIALTRSSGNRALDRAVIHAVERINTLHPMPAEVRNGAAIRANVIFAADNASLVRQEAKLGKEEARLAERERKEGKQVVVLTTNHRTAG